MLDKGYDQETAKLLVRVYRETITYAGLDRENAPSDSPSNDAGAREAVVQGDLVNGLTKERPHTVSAQFAPFGNSASVRSLSIPFERDRTFDLGFPLDLNTTNSISYSRT